MAVNNKNIILGTVQFGLDYGVNNNSGPLKESDIYCLLDTAYDKGIRTLDTAEAYGNAEEIIGRYNKKTKRIFEINTKFSANTHGSIEQSLTNSLTRLKRNNIETYYFHNFSEYTRHPESMDELKFLKHRKKSIRSIGLSVYTNEELSFAVNDQSLDVIQLPFNLLDNTSQRGDLLKEAKKKNKTIQVRSVFLQGLFFKNDLPDNLTPLKPYLDKINNLALRSDVSIETLCLGYVFAQPFIDAAIIGVDNQQQLISNINSSKSVLSPSIISVIDSINVKETPLLYPYNWK